MLCSKIKIFAACGLFAMLLAGSGARADQVYGKIRGTVKDQTGAVVPGAKVTVTDTSTRRGEGHAQHVERLF